MSAVRSEWIKLWTTRTVWWALAAAAVLMAAAAGQYALYADNGDLDPGLLHDGRAPAGTIAVLAVSITQLAFVALAMLVMTTEYSTGLIRSTLAWVPSRGRLLLAKCAVVAVVTFAGGTVAGLLGALVAIPVLGHHGEAGAAAIIGDAVAIGGYLAVLGVLTTGLAAALRGPVVTLVVILLLVVLLPPLLQVPNLAVLNGIADALPGVAGAHFLQRGSAAGLLIIAGWAAAAMLIGWRAMCRRDA